MMHGMMFKINKLARKDSSLFSTESKANVKLLVWIIYPKLWAQRGRRHQKKSKGEGTIFYEYV